MRVRQKHAGKLSRRALLLGAGAIVAAGVGAGFTIDAVGSHHSNSHGRTATIPVGVERWKYGTGDETYTPLAAASGMLYFGSSGNLVHALDATSGDRRWSYEMVHTTSSAPAVGEGTLCIGSDDGRLYALDAATGAKRWSYDMGSAVVGTPVVGNGMVYIGSSNGTVYALNLADGAIR
jgi:eukaryotic-like serine/threonine-protein kinase